MKDSLPYALCSRSRIRSLPIRGGWTGKRFLRPPPPQRSTAVRAQNRQEDKEGGPKQWECKARARGSPRLLQLDSSFPTGDSRLQNEADCLRPLSSSLSLTKAS
ncbi:Hypothetical protein NTJ_02022 [Nesidiocoris tenuis]|uniref:Uncharacterized protein n=1 Tax=Nesidiocoris tenuis TaxID=355587 RepID=A0ABN7AA68_9HEMI|nr:Hypothetical protein NTJ_02022 [Nesidiocoris tenuis]